MSFRSVTLPLHRQGDFGDCWIIAAMTILAAHAPQYLINMFVGGSKVEYSPKGKYVLQLVVDGAPKLVTIDDYFPCTEQPAAEGTGGESEFKLLSAPFQYDKVNNRKIIWPMLIEKAIATEFGSYEHLNGGVIDDALNLMTGTAAFRYNLLNEDIKMKVADGSLWKKMREYSEKCFLMGAGTRTEDIMPQNNMGIVPTHAYAILQVVECDSHKLIELKNPWGETLWNGDWGPFSSKWTRRAKEIISHHRAAARNKAKTEDATKSPLVL